MAQNNTKFLMMFDITSKMKRTQLTLETFLNKQKNKQTDDDISQPILIKYDAVVDIR